MKETIKATSDSLIRIPSIDALRLLQWLGDISLKGVDQFRDLVHCQVVYSGIKTIIGNALIVESNRSVFSFNTYEDKISAEIARPARVVGFLSGVTILDDRQIAITLENIFDLKIEKAQETMRSVASVGSIKSGIADIPVMAITFAQMFTDWIEPNVFR